MATDQNAEDKTVTCPHCGRKVPPAKRCPYCGQVLPKKRVKWSMPELTPTEIFLAVIGIIVLIIGLVAV